MAFHSSLTVGQSVSRRDPCSIALQLRRLGSNRPFPELQAVMIVARLYHYTL